MTARAVRRRRIRPLAWLGPGAARSGRALERRTVLWLVLTLVVANLGGTACVFAFLALLSAPDVTDPSQVRLVNGIAAVVYMSLGMVVGTMWGKKRLAPLRAFLREDREPTAEDRRLVLRAPLRLAQVHLVLWGAAAPLFAALNLTYSTELAARAGATTLLGGVVTTAITYLLSERLLRAATARVLASEAPDRPVLPGVAARSLLAWVLGTALPLIGLISIAISTLTEGDFSRDQLAAAVLVVGGLALVVGLLVVLLAARATADPVRSVRDALARVEHGDLDAEVPVYDGTEVGLLQAGFNRMVAGLRERELIREAFGTYLDPDVAERILAEGPSMEGEEVEVTLLFLDVRDFTGFAERSPPTEVVSTLNRLFELAVPVIQAHGGLVDKFIGDGLLAVFGAIRRESDHADQALAAALEIAAAVEKEFGDEIAGGITVGVGLNTGKVIAGNVGGAGRLEFSVIGDAVNVAARVEAATRETGDTILVSDNTAERLSGGDKLEPRPGIKLKGKREAVALYAPAAKVVKST